MEPSTFTFKEVGTCPIKHRVLNINAENNVNRQNEYRHQIHEKTLRVILILTLKYLKNFSVNIILEMDDRAHHIHNLLLYSGLQ